MEYRVVITPTAQEHLRKYIMYTQKMFKNKQAVHAILEDARQTSKRLSIIAGSLALCDDEILSEYGYRKIMFLRHDFFMIYRLDGNVAVVEGMYHVLQDYESLFRLDMQSQGK